MAASLAQGKGKPWHEVRDRAAFLLSSPVERPRAIEWWDGSAVCLHRRPATHVPEHAPREPTPRQEPPPELVDKRPLPLAYEPPDETLTLTAPLLDTLPLAGPDTIPSWISTPKLELGSQAPRRVMICTVQLPSKREAACAVSPAAVAAIATTATISALESKIFLIAATFDDERNSTNFCCEEETPERGKDATIAAAESSFSRASALRDGADQSAGRDPANGITKVFASKNAEEI